MGVSSYDLHSLAWDSNGAVYSWGDAAEGKLGHHIKDSMTENQIEMFPKKIKSLEKEHVIMGACADKYSMVLTSKGEIYAWGKGVWKRYKNFKQPEFLVLFSRPIIFRTTSTQPNRPRLC